MRIRSTDELGGVVRQRRRELALSQNELAERAEVTRQWLVRFERGNTEVSLSKVFAVLRELGLSVRVAAPPSPAAARTRADDHVVGSITLPQVDDGLLQRSADQVRGIGDDKLLRSLREKIAQLPPATHGAHGADDD
ncbi:helix-turn-helix transcriptional regulator [Herbiconiux sp. CPCC 205716]|uniref:Helix-turn-helix transcriptional regulator n=1 Tax=Herbiconiux gentiana TaxID=2970912 RepID=A0ABT2GHL0_9MICO|nr:helix-turn-helix transcriptional regulator [Herbiconiux gentiana]MCS5714750.1 helix-turn-helix transcriptional regulator [Herbiconiux gentiana]